MIYIICFAVAVFLANRACVAKKKVYLWLLSVVSILVLTLLAGLRDYSIGIDTKNYLSMDRFWAGASKQSGLMEYLRYYLSLGYREPLFALICGFFAQIFESYTLFLCFSHAIIVTCVYIGAYRLRDKANPAFVLLLFCLVFYNHSLNIMRQYMAMAIVFAALADILQKKYVRYAIVVIIAALMHTSVLLSLGGVFLHWFLECDIESVKSKIKTFWAKITRRTPKNEENHDLKTKNNKNIINRFLAFFRERVKSVVRRKQITVFVALSLLVLLFNPLCRLAIYVGILGKKYLFYLNISEAEHTTLITLFLLLELAALVLFYKKLKQREESFEFFFSMTVVYLILQQVSMFLVYGKRIAAHYSLANLITIAIIPRMFKDKKQRILIYIIIGCIVLFYWFYTYILRNASDTFPYKLIFEI